MTTSRVSPLVLLLAIVSLLYGASYQQFRHFKLAEPCGLRDTASYVAMMHGDFGVNPVHRYRALVPCAARGVRVLLARFVADSQDLDKLSFYVVNFAIATATAWLLFGILRKIGFAWQLGLFGVAIFLSSRVTVMSVGTPLVDSLYFFGIAVITYLVLADKETLLACVCPLLVLSKETMLPFLFLPLLCRNARTLKMACASRRPWAFSFSSGAGQRGDGGGGKSFAGCDRRDARSRARAGGAGEFAYSAGNPRFAQRLRLLRPFRDVRPRRQFPDGQVCDSAVRAADGADRLRAGTARRRRQPGPAVFCGVCSGHRVLSCAA